MKKLMLQIMTALFLLAFVPVQLRAVSETITNSTPINRPVESAETEALLTRLDEIKTMDKSELSGPQKRALRKEVRGIKHELKEKSRGVYLSVGALLIVVLLLILLL